MDKKEQLSAIMKSTGEIRKHFNRVHADAMSQLQEVKTELFELNIRLDECLRTKNLYAMNRNHKKNVFSPIPADDPATRKETELEEKINALTTRKEALEQRKAEAEALIRETENHLKNLHIAQLSAAQLSHDPAFQEDDSDDEGFEFLETDETPPEDLSKHGEQILLLDAFDKTYLATVLDKRVRIPLSSQTHRLQTLRKFLTTDPRQAQLMLDEFETQNEQILSTLQAQLTRIEPGFDEKQPIGSILDTWIMRFRDQHPEYVLESSVQVRNESQVIPYIRTLTLIRIIEAAFDNIVRHSDANQIRFRVQVNGSVADVFISDNGIGIPGNVMQAAPWYSSLHRAEETLFLLGGRMQLTGSKDHGTTMRFTLPV
ncbi:MAG: hypothetical protein K5897_08820 [Eubacterium sp.]|nr:hypothetical protein [Eubacterium sp.]